MQVETLADARKMHGTAEGTSRKLEKQYMRLTSAPDRSEVRPPVILEQALQALKDKWLEVSQTCHTCETCHDCEPVFAMACNTHVSP